MASDLKINGTGKSSGGKYENISIMGAGSIDGDVDCLNIKIYGEGNVDGDLQVNDTVKIKGHVAINGYLGGGDLKVQGEVEVQSASIEKAEIEGNIKTEKDFNAETFKLEGGFNIRGLLNADEIEVNMYWPCKAEEIGGSKIKVTQDSRLSFLGLKNIIKPNGSAKELIVDIIEGDDIYLEYTKARVVRGNDVELGPGCKIELVEYNNLKQDEKSVIKTYKEI